MNLLHLEMSYSQTRNFTMIENIDQTVLDLIESIKGFMVDRNFAEVAKLYPHLTTESDKEFIRKEVNTNFANDPQFKPDTLKAELLLGVENGYSIEEQIELIKNIFKL
jgi:hypothetical protein